MKYTTKWLLETSIAVIIIACLGFGLYLTCINIHKDYVLRHIILTNNSKNFKFWSDTSKLPSTHLDFYFFNWTNPDELTKPGNKPNLVQVGPYSFIEISQKVNITFHSNNGTVSYFQRRFWYFDEKHSNGTLEDKVSLLNATVVLDGRIVQMQPYFLKTVSYHVSKRPNLCIIKSVGDLLIGYEELPYLKHFHEFLYLSKRNGTVDTDNFNVATGEKNISQLGLLKKWNYQNTSSYFEKICNQIEGSIGDFWPPNLIDYEIKLFMPELCRALIYEFDKTTDYMGIEGFKYTLGDRTLKNDRNICYLLKVPKGFNFKNLIEICQPKNMIEQCYCAEPRISNQIVGMSPNEEEHSFYIILEPYTGIPLEITKRLQINLLLHRSPDILFFSNVSTIYFPIFWYSKKIKLPKELTSELQVLISFNSLILKSFIIIIVIGILIYCLASWYHKFNCINYMRVNNVTIETDTILLDDN
ncbi:protein peste-like isoform X2 [Polistes fuscatus]|uniref:protein peste-like isoform X2 n=1 Tax=Polistes fuscatus TaxID=30207 RepID=UPI001CA9DA3F|nr:protein peste-like isoform X2 [Polistes fuscatus]